MYSTPIARNWASTPAAAVPSAAEVFFPDSWIHRDGEIVRPDWAIIGTYDAEWMDLSKMSYTSELGPIEGCSGGTFTLKQAYIDAMIPRISSS